MCGICGIWYFDANRTADEAVVWMMRDRLTHRGPDEVGLYCAGSLGIGVRRLNVIDQVGSSQPIANEDGTIRVACNGEIYNFRALRRSLEARHHFATNGDAEVIAHLYEECGGRCVDALNGMYAFALWDGAAQRLMLAVDRFGEKPLYYRLDTDKIVFGSEIKALRAFPGFESENDDEALDAYFADGYIHAPHTIFRQIRRLPAGHAMTLSRTGVAQVEQYWQPEFSTPEGWDRRSERELADELRQRLIEAVESRLISDVPVGAFLSGGVDSSSVVALMRRLTDAPIKTFSVGFDEEAYDERRYARAVADYYGVTHYTEVVRPVQVVDLLPKLVHQFDEPFADASMIPTYVVSRLARQQVTVALSGDGGDEVFAGYHQHLYGYRQQYLESIIPKALHPAAAQAAEWLPRAAKVTPYLATLGYPASRWRTNGFFNEAQRDRLFNRQRYERSKGEADERLARLDGVSQLQLYDLTVYLQNDILVKVDRASMLASLEVRAPLLDHRLFEFMATVPTYWRLDLRSGKRLLKRAMRSLPTSALRRSKQGFSIPQGEWLRGALQPMLRDTLAASTSFNRAYVQELVEEHTRGRANHRDRLWALLCYELWKRA